MNANRVATLEQFITRMTTLNNCIIRRILISLDRFILKLQENVLSGKGKGANATISYVHHFFTRHGLGETEAQIHADNCSSQNKNNPFIWYYIWRVMTGLHHAIEYSFLVAGHTKFSPDWCFGLLKQKTRRTFTSSLFDIA